MSEKSRPGRLSANLTLNGIMKSYGRGSPRSAPAAESRQQEQGSLAVGAQKASLERSLYLFMADPAGSQASYHMGMVFRCVEGLPPEVRESAAASVAERILKCLDSCPKAKRGIAATHVFSRMLPPTALSRKINEQMESRQPAREAPKPAKRSRVAPAASASPRPDSEDERFVQQVNMWARRHGYRNVRREELSTLMREGFERKLNGAAGGPPPRRDPSSISIMKPLPKNRMVLWMAGALAAIVLTVGIAAGVHVSNVRVEDRPGLYKADMGTVEESFRNAIAKEVEIEVKDEKGKKAKIRRRMINNEVIIRARRLIPKEHKGPLNISQVFDIYDFNLRQIIYLSDSDPQFPQDAEVTLAAGGGDCKSKAALLCAMLESIGVKTVIYATRDANGKGHIYIGVRVGSGEGKVRETDKLVVKAAILDRYRKQIEQRLGTVAKFQPQFREVYGMDPTKNGTYLLLDTAFENADDTAPGIVGNGLVEKEYFMVPRPGLMGVRMELD